MKNLLISATIALFGIGQSYQMDGIQISDYDTQIRCHVDSLSVLDAPYAESGCENAQLTVENVDVTFSGGKHGTIQREWTYLDSCGNTGQAIQYITLFD